MKIPGICVNIRWWYACTCDQWLHHFPYLHILCSFLSLFAYSLDNNAHYDSLEGCYAWAKETLAVHSTDVREVLYTSEELEEG